MFLAARPPASHLSPVLKEPLLGFADFPGRSDPHSVLCALGSVPARLLLLPPKVQDESADLGGLSLFRRVLTGGIARPLSPAFTASKGPCDVGGAPLGLPADPAAHQECSLKPPHGLNFSHLLCYQLNFRQVSARCMRSGLFNFIDTGFGPTL